MISVEQIRAEARGGNVSLLQPKASLGCRRGMIADLFRRPCGGLME